MNVLFPPFEPDKAISNPAGAPWVLNALPRVDGWGPQPSLQEISTALAADCRGCFSCQKLDGSWVTFAWTTTKAYRLNSSTNTWVDVTRTSGGDYAVPLNNMVVARKFGPYVISANGADVLQVFNVETPSTAFANLAGTPPIARGLEVIGDFLVAYNIVGETGRLQWCEINDITGWDAGENLSDYNDLPDLGPIQYIVPSASGGIVCCALGFMSMIFALESQWVFTFALIHKARGVSSAYAVVPIGPGDFIYHSFEGWYRGDASIGGEKIDRWFSSFANIAEIISMQGGLDPYGKIAWFRFKSKNSTYFLLGYNYLLDRWCLSDNQLIAMMRIGSPIITNDTMDAFFATIDDIDVPYDSTFWAGGAPAFGGITNNRKLAYQSAAPAQATFETANLEFGGGMRTMVNGGRAMTDSVDITAEIATSDYRGGAFTWRPAVVPSARTKLIPFRADGRQHKVRITVPAASSWTYVQGLDVSVAAGGGL